MGGAGHQGEGHAGEETENQTVTSVSLESRGPIHVSPVYTPQCFLLFAGLQAAKSLGTQLLSCREPWSYSGFRLPHFSHFLPGFSF